VPEDLVSVVLEENVLSEDSSESKHSKTSIVEFSVLVANPSFIAVVDPVSRSEDVTGDVARALLDLFRQPLNRTATNDKLEPSYKGELVSGLKRVAGKAAVEGRVDTTGGDEPSQTGSHGNTAVLEFRLTVVRHGGVALALRQTDRIEESNRGRDSDDSLVNPCRHRGRGASGLRYRSKGGGRADKSEDGGELHGQSLQNTED
jgi:hypothetical protein